MFQWLKTRLFQYLSENLPKKQCQCQRQPDHHPKSETESKKPEIKNPDPKKPEPLESDDPRIFRRTDFNSGACSYRFAAESLRRAYFDRSYDHNFDRGVDLHNVMALVDPEHSPEYIHKLFGPSSDSKFRQVDGLNEMLKEIWEAHQAGKPIHPRDEIVRSGVYGRRLGFIIGDEWVLCPVVGVKASEVILPEVASLFGLTPEEAKECLFDYKLRQWLAGWFPGVSIPDQEIEIQDQDLVAKE